MGWGIGIGKGMVRVNRISSNNRSNSYLRIYSNNRHKHKKIIEISIESFTTVMVEIISTITDHLKSKTP